jgi:hypothetical protein
MNKPKVVVVLLMLIRIARLISVAVWVAQIAQHLDYADTWGLELSILFHIHFKLVQRIAGVFVVVIRPRIDQHTPFRDGGIFGCLTGQDFNYRQAVRDFNYGEANHLFFSPLARSNRLTRQG